MNTRKEFNPQPYKMETPNPMNKPVNRYFEAVPVEKEDPPQTRKWYSVICDPNEMDAIDRAFYSDRKRWICIGEVHFWLREVPSVTDTVSDEMIEAEFDSIYKGSIFYTHPMRTGFIAGMKRMRELMEVKQ